MDGRKSINKNPENFKYVAYMRVEVEHFVYYYHFYLENGKITVRKPHINLFEDKVNKPLIRKYVKPIIRNSSDDIIYSFYRKLTRKIVELEEKYNCIFEIIDDVN